MQVDYTQRRPQILLAACGSVAAVKFPILCKSFSEWAEVRAVATKTALRFIDREILPNNVVLYVDEHDWTTWGNIGDPMLHIELSSWADIMVIAPLTANTLGKIAGGLCDNLLTCIVRAWDYSKPLFLAPCMNPLMWSNYFTEHHLDELDDLGTTLIRPRHLEPCPSAMAEPSHICSTVRQAIESRGRNQASSGNM